MAGLEAAELRGLLERMLRADQVHVTRHKVLVEGRSQRQVAKECDFADHRPEICGGIDSGSEGNRAWRDRSRRRSAMRVHPPAVLSAVTT